MGNQQPQQNTPKKVIKNENNSEYTLRSVSKDEKKVIF